MSDTDVLSESVLPVRKRQAFIPGRYISEGGWDHLEITTFIDVNFAEPQRPKPPTSFWSADINLIDLSSPSAANYRVVVDPRGLQGIFTADAKQPMGGEVPFRAGAPWAHYSEPDLIILNAATGIEVTGNVVDVYQFKYIDDSSRRMPKALIGSLRNSWLSRSFLTGFLMPQLASGHSPSPSTGTDDDNVLPAQVALLEVLLGSALASYIAGLSETGPLAAWASGRASPDEPIRQRIELALEAARLIARYEDERMAQSWFQGANPLLEGQSPARWLRTGEYSAGDFIAAAKAYLAS
jgi:hypothetical protein